MKTPTRRSLIWLSSAYLAFGMPTNAQTTAAPDLDRDGIANINDPDVDNDGLLNGADRNIDGGTARSGPLKGRYIGDRLNNDNAAEADMDADGLADNSLKETDIDGDNIVNDEDPDMDSDGVENEIDEDFDNDGVKDTIDFTDDGGNGSFIDDDSAKPTNDFVSSKLSELLGVANDSRLKVAVMSTTEPYGTWNYRTSDGISVNGVWSYPADKPEELKPFMSNAAGENRIYAQYPNGFLTFYSWLPDEPVGFAFSTLSEQATGKTAPIARLHSYVSGFPNAYPEILPQVISGSTSIMFYGDLPVFDGIGPIVDQQRAIFKIVTDWEKENYPTDRR